MRKLIIILFVLYSATGLRDPKKGFHFNLGFGYVTDSDLKDTGWNY